ncbi:prolyl oligopeptidase family serine peptidase [Rubrivirga sp. IMCC43871]|uniref:S9 family peptidase n=1 Tax=Rubrivirga sp. IMCC43871 TaxID=3391575 RepID=UPI00399015D3
MRSSTLPLVVLLTVLATSAAAQPAEGPPLIPRVMMLWPDLPEFRPVGPEPRPVEPGLFAHVRPVFEVPSPDGAWLAGTADGALTVRAADADTPALTVPVGDGPRWSVASAKWSPDGARLAVRRVDDSAVPRIPMLGAEGDTVRWAPYSRAGEPLPDHRLWVVERATGDAAPVPHEPGAEFVHAVGWSPDGARLRYLEADRLLRRLDLREFDVHTGRARTLLREEAEGRVIGIEMIHGYGGRLDGLGWVTFVDGGRFVWTSERTGEAHLSLYDADGGLVRPLTEGALPGPVQRVAHVDRAAGALYVVAVADAERPWDHALFRVGLGGDVRKVADGPVIEEVVPTDGGDLLVVRAGFPDRLQVDRVTPGGETIGTPWVADWGFIGDLPRRHERLVLTSADGVTPLDAVLVLPPGDHPAQSVALVDYAYGGPNAVQVPRSPQTPWLWEAYRLAEQGLATLFVDGRGSPGRGRAFLDVSAGRIGQVEVADHRAAVEQVLARFPELDPARVAVLGHSLGGVLGLRAVAEAPDVFRAAVLFAPAVDAATMRVWVEPYMGCLPADCPAAYAASAGRPLADRVEAAVMIVHGTADDDVPYAEGAGLAAALEAAGVDVTFVTMPGTDHIVQRSPEVWAQAVAFLRAPLR